MSRASTLACAVLTGLALCLATAPAAQESAAAELSLDSLLNTRISAASKYAQRAAEAPASVSIITSDDIRNHGYRTIEQVLEDVRGFYVSNDRNYPYLGSRGFSRPTDYNNRMLVLVDGHTLNESVWGGAPIGSDLPISLAAIERIEIVRGPGSVLYGTGAMFAVINIVTKSGTDLDGLLARAEVGSSGMREASVVGGRALGARVSIAGSILASRSDGGDLYFAEYDAPETHGGIARGLDWEERLGGLGRATIGGVTARVGYRWRAKGIPTGAYDVAFGDPASRTTDANLWGDLVLERSVRGVLRLTTRVYGDRYTYWGAYAQPDDPVYVDEGVSTTGGVESMAILDLGSRHRLTLGAEWRTVVEATYVERFSDGTVLSDDAPYRTVSVYAQDEFQFSPRVTMVAGARLDAMSEARSALVPRLALVATPDRLTSLKLLYGEAFRAPAAAEARIETSFYVANPALEPERVQTVEFAVERTLGRALLLGGSVYEYRIRNLIDQVEIDDSDVLQYRNVAASRGRGLELALDVMPGRPLSARASYAWQRAVDRSSGEELTNSPAQVGTLTLLGRSARGLRSTIGTRVESGRRTLDGGTTDAFVRTDASLAYALPRALAGGAGHSAELSLRVRNVFDRRYGVPGGVEHRQAAIVQEGRAFALRLDWAY